MSKILIIEDNEIDRKIISQVLTQKGHEVLELGSGETCLEIVDTQRPDLVVLDILMPGVEGGAILHLLRKKYSAIELPVIMVTSKTDAADIVEFLHLGANDYLAKPLNLEIAHMRIETQLRIAELSRQTTRLKELEVINAMAVTYNHEINNPLSIALGALTNIAFVHREEKDYQRLENALWRIAEIVKKTSTLAIAAREKSVNFEEYRSGTKMVKMTE